MSEKNEAVVRRMLQEVWNDRKLDAIERFFVTDYMNHDPLNPTIGLDAYRSVVEKYHTAFPDCRIDIDDGKVWSLVPIGGKCEKDGDLTVGYSECKTCYEVCSEPFPYPEQCTWDPKTCTFVDNLTKGKCKGT